MISTRLNIPKTLKDFGINEDEFKEKVDKIAELAVGDACARDQIRVPLILPLWQNLHVFILRNRG